MAATVQYKLKAYGDFSGGWNADSAPDLLADNECEIFDNIDTSISGALKQRGGTVPLNNDAYDGDLTKVWEWHRKNGDTQYLAIVGKNLCFLEPDNDWAAHKLISLDSDMIGHFFFNDKFYFTGSQSGRAQFWQYGGIYYTLRLDYDGTVTNGGGTTLTVSILSMGIDIKRTVQMNTGNTATEVTTNALDSLLEDEDFVKYFKCVQSGSFLDISLKEPFRKLEDMPTDFIINAEVRPGITVEVTDKTEGFALQNERLFVDKSSLVTTPGTISLTVICKSLIPTAPHQITVTTANIPNGQASKNIVTAIKDALIANTTINNSWEITSSSNQVRFKWKTAKENDDTFDLVWVYNSIVGVILTHENYTPGMPLTGVINVKANGDATNDLDPILRCTHFVWNPVNFRCFATGDPEDISAIYYSEPNDPTFFKATSKLYPTRGEGPCKGLANFSTGVVCAYENTLWTFTGVDPAADATWKSLPLVHGALNQGSICATPNSLTMLGVGGLYALSPGALDKDLMMINASQLSINLAINKVSSVLNSALHISTMVSCYDNTKQRYLLAYGDELDSLKNNRILVFDFARNCFARYTGIQANYFCVTSDGRVLIASGKYLLQLDQGVNDVNIDKVHSNLLVANQADVEFDTSGFSAFSSATLTRDTGEHWHGSASLKVVTPNAVAGEGMYANAPKALVAGEQYAASAYVKGSGSVRIGLRERTGGVEATTYGVGVTLNGEWQRLSITHTVTDANNTQLLMMVRTLTQQAATFYVDGLQIESGDIATDWFVGSRVDYKPIETHVRTKGWNQDTPFIVKKLKKTFVAAYQYPTSGTTVDLGLIGGYRSQVFEHVPSIVYQDSSLPDSFIWGEDWGNVWGWADLVTREFRTRMKATRFAIDIKHNKLDEDMLIYGIALLYRTKKAKGVRYHGVADKNILS